LEIRRNLKKVELPSGGSLVGRAAGGTLSPKDKSETWASPPRGVGPHPAGKGKWLGAPGKLQRPANMNREIGSTMLGCGNYWGAEGKLRKRAIKTFVATKKRETASFVRITSLKVR